MPSSRLRPRVCNLSGERFAWPRPSTMRTPVAPLRSCCSPDSRPLLKYSAPHRGYACSGYGITVGKKTNLGTKPGKVFTLIGTTEVALFPRTDSWPGGFPELRSLPQRGRRASKYLENLCALLVFSWSAACSSSPSLFGPPSSGRSAGSSMIRSIVRFKVPW